MSIIPIYHNGEAYDEFLAQLARKRAVKRYLEIGVSKGELLRKISARFSVGVDPSYDLNCNVMAGKSILTLVQTTSDEFFADSELKFLLGGAPDLVFLDGMHTFEYLLRDFYNAENYSSTSSLIAIHDCLPLDEAMASRSHLQMQKIDSKFPGWWTGDVWKILPILKEYRPDLIIYCVNCGPTGLILVTNLDPKSTVLQSNYFNIVGKYREIASSTEELETLYESLTVLDSSIFLNEFDHSLYLRM